MKKEKKKKMKNWLSAGFSLHTKEQKDGGDARSKGRKQ